MNRLMGIKILIVDDDEMLREVLSEIFIFEGAQTTEANNGTVAFTLIKKAQFDVVISDVRMPGGDGLSLARSIAELPGNKPLVFLCSGFNDLSAERAEELNILKVFDKPFDQDTLAGELSLRLANRP